MADNSLQKIITIKIDTKNSDVSLEQINNALSDLGLNAKETSIALEGSEKALLNQINALIETRNATATTTAEYDKQSKAIIELQAKLSVLQGKAVNVGEAMHQFGNKTGLASATVVEAGRMITDFNYGLPAMANNITQVASLMTTLVGTTGGLKNALIQLRTVLLGPIGILLAFQTVITVLEHFSKKKKEVKEQSESSTKSIQDEISVLKTYKTVLEGVNEESSERAEILAYLSNKYKDLAEAIKKANGDSALEDAAIRRSVKIRELKVKLIEEENKAVELGIEINKTAGNREKTEELLLKAKKKLVEIQEKLNNVSNKDEIVRGGLIRQYQAQSSFVQRLTNLLNDEKTAREGVIETIKELNLLESRKINVEAKEGSVGFYKERISKLEELREKYSSDKKLYDSYTKAIADLQAKIDAITGGEQKGGRKPKNKIVKDFKSNVLDLEKEILKWNSKEKELAAKNAFEKIEEERKFAVESLRIKIDEFVEKERLRLLDYANSGATDKQIEEAKREFGRNLQDIVRQTEEDVLAINNFFRRKELEEIEKINDKILKSTLSQIEKANYLKQKIALLREEQRIKDNERLLKYRQELFDSSISFLDAQYNAEITREKNKTNAINNELRERLANENLSKEERRKIQGEIAENDEKLRVKQEKIARKQFEMNKAAQIASTIVNTYSAAMSAAKDDWGGPAKRMIGIALIVATGLANVAKIMSTRFQTTASSVSGGALVSGDSQGGSGRNFDFNLVGNTGRNQLEEAIASKFAQPIRAYVVSKEISNQQELDINIRNAATIG